MSSNDRLLERLHREFPSVTFALASAGKDGRHAVIIDGRISDVLMFGEEDIRKFTALFGDISEEEVISTTVDLVRKDLDPDDELTADDLFDISADDMIELAEIGDTIELADFADDDDILPFPFTD